MGKAYSKTTLNCQWQSAGFGFGGGENEKKEEGAGLAGQGAILFLLGPLTQLSSFTLVCDSPSSQVPSIRRPNPSKGRKRMIKICIIYTALQLCFLGQATARVVVALINLLTGSLCSSFKVISIFSTRCVGEKPSISTPHRTHRIRSPRLKKVQSHKSMLHISQSSQDACGAELDRKSVHSAIF